MQSSSSFDRLLTAASPSHDVKSAATFLEPNGCYNNNDPHDALLEDSKIDSTSFKIVSTTDSQDLLPEVEFVERSSNKNAQAKIDEALTMNKLRFEELGLYGRHGDQKQLEECLQRSLDTDTGVELVFLSGLSGCGKTALALSLLDKVKRKGGIFASGKYDLAVREEPYSAIAEACRELCQQAETLQQLTELQAKLAGALDSLEVHLLREIVPALQGITIRRESQTDLMNMVDVDQIPAEDKGLFLNVAFTKFLAVASSCIQPLVLFIDDVQWADASSLGLLEAITGDINNKHTMVMASHRSNEVEDGLLQCIQRIRESPSSSLTELSLDNLSLTDVRKYLGDLLSMADSKSIEELADICHRRTMGNPYFVQMFVATLKDKKLLQFNVGTLNWSWNCSDIETSSVAADNVAGLIRDNIKERADDHVGLMLVHAACLGNVFTGQHLHLVWEKHRTIASPSEQESIPSLSALLEESVDELFLEKIGESKYRFVHDAVREASVSLLPSDKFRELQYSIGLILQQELSEDELNNMIFVVVQLLNSSNAQDVDLARLNLQAATKAQSLSAFSSAAIYASQGMERLPNMWEKNIKLSLELFAVGAEAERCIGNVDKAREYCQTVLQNEHISPSDKIPFHHVMLAILEHEDQFSKLTHSSRLVSPSLAARYNRELKL